MGLICKRGIDQCEYRMLKRIQRADVRSKTTQNWQIVMMNEWKLVVKYG